MIIKEVLDVHLAAKAHKERTIVPGGDKNFQNQYVRDRQQSEDAFDEFVAGRPYVEIDANNKLVEVFKPVNLGKYVVEQSNLSVPAQPSIERTRATRYYTTRTEGEVSERQVRAVRLFVPDLVPRNALQTVGRGEDAWSYIDPTVKKLQQYCAPRFVVDESRHTALQSSVGSLREFEEFFSELVAAEATIDQRAR